MSPFQKAPCPKCNAAVKTLRLRWCDESYGYGMSHRKHCPRTEMHTLAPEHIHHVCTSCGYERVTRTADARSVPFSLPHPRPRPRNRTCPTPADPLTTPAPASSQAAATPTPATPHLPTSAPAAGASTSAAPVAAPTAASSPATSSAVGASGADPGATRSDLPTVTTAGDMLRDKEDPLNRASFVHAADGVALRHVEGIISANHLYTTPSGSVMQGVVVWNRTTGAVTVSVPDPGVDCHALVQSLWGPLAGGHPGNARSPHGLRLGFHEADRAVAALKRALQDAGRTAAGGRALDRSTVPADGGLNAGDTE